MAIVPLQKFPLFLFHSVILILFSPRKVSGPWLNRTEQQNSAEHPRPSCLDSHLRTSPGLLLKSGYPAFVESLSRSFCAKNHFYCLFRVNKIFLCLFQGFFRLGRGNKSAKGRSDMLADMMPRGIEYASGFDPGGIVSASGFDPGNQIRGGSNTLRHRHSDF